MSMVLRVSSRGVDKTWHFVIWVYDTLNDPRIMVFRRGKLPTSRSIKTAKKASLADVRCGEEDAGQEILRALVKNANDAIKELDQMQEEELAKHLPALALTVTQDTSGAELQAQKPEIRNSTNTSQRRTNYSRLLPGHDNLSAQFAENIKRWKHNFNLTEGATVRHLESLDWSLEYTEEELGIDLQSKHIRNQSSTICAWVYSIREDILPDLVPRGFGFGARAKPRDKLERLFHGKIWVGVGGPGVTPLTFINSRACCMWLELEQD
ncbi:hypothetical protein DM02DRAFT_658398 [Periconia macrospinosa]|uniref:Uncharacterized protein n=1 Tax=Periconia macrospinosa TaxID=97972 RepID=A0A2V1DJL9_9PLEO|nr:hypothetical protein DM02DRAFT_658398 [Periconia macrospinosa]